MTEAQSRTVECSKLGHSTSSRPEQDEADTAGVPDQIAQPGVVLEGRDTALLRGLAVDRLERVDDERHRAALLGRTDGIHEVEADAFGQTLVEQGGARAADLLQQRLGPPVERFEALGEDAVDVLVGSADERCFGQQLVDAACRVLQALAVEERFRQSRRQPADDCTIRVQERVLPEHVRAREPLRMDAGEGEVEEGKPRLAPSHAELQAKLQEGLHHVLRRRLGEVDRSEGRLRGLEPAAALPALSDLADDPPAQRRFADAADPDKEQDPPLVGPQRHGPELVRETELLLAAAKQLGLAMIERRSLRLAQPWRSKRPLSVLPVAAASSTQFKRMWGK
jgi:hypothetical protein